MPANSLEVFAIASALLVSRIVGCVLCIYLPAKYMSDRTIKLSKVILLYVIALISLYFISSLTEVVNYYIRYTAHIILCAGLSMMLLNTTKLTSIVCGLSATVFLYIFDIISVEVYVAISST